MKKLASIVTLLAMVLAITMSVGVGAATWPTKPINIIVPWGPGGASDLAARTLAVEMEKVLGQRIAITIRPVPQAQLGHAPCSMRHETAIRGVEMQTEV